MLYDPKWEKPAETKADPFSLATLIAWLERQSPDARYDYACNGHCLLAQYFCAHGFQRVSVGPWSLFDFVTYIDHRLPPGFDDIAMGHGDRHNRSDYRTFGAA